LTNPLDELLNFAHRSYVRMEAEQLIIECLELEDISPFNDMLEKLVLAGATSLYLLREVLEEVMGAKSLLNQEGLGVRQDLMDALNEFGVNIPELLYADGPEAFHQIYNRTIQSHIRENASFLRPGDEALLEEICADASERVMKIARRVTLLNSLEDAIRDWMGSLAYEMMRSRGIDSGPFGKGTIH
jgi:hypothetical protein